MHENLQQVSSRKLNGVHLDLEWGTSETLLIAIQVDGHASPPGSSGVLVNGIEAEVMIPSLKRSSRPVSYARSISATAPADLLATKPTILLIEKLSMTTDGSIAATTVT